MHQDLYVLVVRLPGADLEVDEAHRLPPGKRVILPNVRPVRYGSAVRRSTSSGFCLLFFLARRLLPALRFAARALRAEIVYPVSAKSA
jgi:hypothetical protein